MTFATITYHEFDLKEYFIRTKKPLVVSCYEVWGQWVAQIDGIKMPSFEMGDSSEDAITFGMGDSITDAVNDVSNKLCQEFLKLKEKGGEVYRKMNEFVEQYK